MSKWNSTGILNISDYYSMNAIKDTKNDEKMYVYIQ